MCMNWLTICMYIMYVCMCVCLVSWWSGLQPVQRTEDEDEGCAFQSPSHGEAPGMVPTSTGVHCHCHCHTYMPHSGFRNTVAVFAMRIQCICRQLLLLNMRMYVCDLQGPHNSGGGADVPHRACGEGGVSGKRCPSVLFVFQRTAFQ